MRWGRGWRPEVSTGGGNWGVGVLNGAGGLGGAWGSYRGRGGGLTWQIGVMVPYGLTWPTSPGNDSLWVDLAVISM